ncbi:hypothetical protein [Ancylobacter sp.]|uniref:hypothetical protein n=1 Tax=Ancylobacter sp. TaxID=1872567 RepID=UPI003BA94342
MIARPGLSKILASMDALVRLDAPAVCHRAKALRKSEAELLSVDLKHARDFIAKAAARPQEARWLMEGTQVAPVAAIQSAARQIAEEGGE